MFQGGMSMESFIRTIEQRAPTLSRHTVLRAMSYFDDAENDPEPMMLQDVRWKDIKDELSRRVVKYVRHEIQGPRL